MSHTTECIKNVTLTGHGGTGKTTLFEHLLFAGGAIPKAETIESGKTVSDAAPEEIERKISIHAALGHIERRGLKINLFDTPGSSDFTGDVILTFRCAELVLLVLDARTGPQIETLKLWRTLENRAKESPPVIKPRAFFAAKMDDDRADFPKVLEDIKEKFKINPVIASFPMGQGPTFQGVIDVIQNKAFFIQKDAPEKEGPIPPEYQSQTAAAQERLLEAAAEGDEILLEHYILLGTLEPEEIKRGLRQGLARNKFVPVFAGAGLKNSGLIPFLDFLADLAPNPKTAQDIAQDPKGGNQGIPLDPNKPLAALVVKTVYDQFSGKLSWIKIIQGKLSPDSEGFNISENKKERIGKLYLCQGKKLEETRELQAGDVGLIAKSGLKTNDTLAGGPGTLPFLPLRLPEPVHAVAVTAGAKKDDDKLGEALLKAAEEDKTFRYLFNEETKERVLSGMGELHVTSILEKIKQTQKIEIETRIPRVPYRETIAKKASAEYTHKKQTGGHGQYGRVAIEIAPLPRGAQYKFINAIFGGAISKSYIPGVEKGLLEGMASGTLAGYPVVDVEIKIVDGKEHPVDSSELAFKLAARNAFREAMRQAGPTLLEPIMNLTVFAESKYLGDVMSDLSSKRGKILGQDSVGGIEEIRAQVPQAELLRYSIDLRSLTSGTGSFNVDFDHYAPIAGKIAEEVIKAAQSFKTQETDD
ncbi:MAG: elongation factor G [Spirochaetaceae bacterium]|jgi:elongation factor G|nr:elongation factor G [Spirochaetaceae bacterium]